MYCSACKEVGTVGGEGTFISGNSNFKLESVKVHDKTKDHVDNVLRLKAKSGVPGTSSAEGIIKTLNSENFKKLERLFRIAHALCKKGRPHTDYVWLCDLEEASGLELGKTYRNEMAVVNFIRSIADNERARIQKNISMANFVSVITDGSTDSSHTETEIVFVRYCNKGVINLHFAGVKNVPKADASNIVKSVHYCLQSLIGDSYKQKIVGVGCDGASVMLGCKAGFVIQLKSDLNRPYVVGIHCSGHRLELAFKDALKPVPLYTKLDTLLLGLYLFYRNSPLNRSNLKEACKVVGMKTPLVPTRVGGTRWVPHLKRAMVQVLSSYEAIIMHLSQIQVNNNVAASKALHFLKVLQSKDFWLFLNLMLDVVSVLTDVSLAFQRRDAGVGDVMCELNVAKTNLDSLKTNNGPHMRKVENCVAAPGVPELKGSDTSYVSARKKTIDNLTASLAKRFADESGLLQASRVANLSLWPADYTEDYGNGQVVILLDHFADALRSAGLDPDVVEQEWTWLKSNIHDRMAGSGDVVLTWAHINKQFYDRCKNFLGLIDLVLSLPACSVEAERGFNQLKLAKTDWRSRLTDSHLSDELMILLESASVREFDPGPAVHLWNNRSVRLRHIFHATESVKANNKGSSSDHDVMTVTIDDDNDEEELQAQVPKEQAVAELENQDYSDIEEEEGVTQADLFAKEVEIEKEIAELTKDNS